MTRIAHLLNLIMIAFVAAISAQAQSSMCQNDSDVSVVPTLSILTCSPGSDIYELEGHTGLRIRTPYSDDVVHWGLFDFSAPNFVYRFVKGETDYRIGIMPTDYFLQAYASAGRNVTEQALNLTDAEAIKAINLIEENLLPENRVYRYNYVKDNCATRPLNIIEKAVGEDIYFSKAPDYPGKSHSFRSIMDYYHQNYPWYQFGIDIALGNEIDVPVTPHEMAFAPVALCYMLDNAVFTPSDRKVVLSTHIIAGDEGSDVRLAPTPWYLTPAAAGCYLLVLSLLFMLRSLRKKKINRWFYSLIYLIIGITGCIVAFLVFISVHEATDVNWQILWLNPFALLVPLLIWWKRCSSVLKGYFLLNTAAIVTLSLAVLFGAQSISLSFLPYLLADLLLSVNYLIVLRHDKDHK